MGSKPLEIKGVLKDTWTLYRTLFLRSFLTGFVVSNAKVWARPVGVGVAQDGSLIVTEDANGTVWRVSYKGDHGQAAR